MSAPEQHSHTVDDNDSWSLPSMGRASSDFPWATLDANGEWPTAEMPIPQASASQASHPTELNDDDAHPWTPVGEAAQNSNMFIGASPSLDGYLHQGSPNRLSVRLNSTQADGHSHTLSELPPEPCLMPPITPDSAQGIPTEPIYLSDSDLYPDALRHRRHVSASSIRLRTLPSLRRGERKKTAVLERKRNSVMQQALSRGTVAPGQPSKVWRVRDGKFLQTEWKGPVALEGQVAVESRDVQVTAWCLGMGIDLQALHKVLVERFGEDKVTVFPRPPEHVHPAKVSREFSGELVEIEDSRAQADYEAKQEAVDQANILHLYYSDPNGHLQGEAVYVEYGSVVTWGIPIDLHSEVVFKLAGEFLEDPKDYGAIQADSMKVQVMDGDVKPTIQNDTMLLHHELFDQLEVRVGMSLALAQSTRLSMQEELTMRIIARTKNYPELLVQHGHVHFNEEDLSKTIGSVFLEKTQLNLQVLSGPYNYPKFFSSCPDHVQKLYSLVSDNFHLDDRADILNRRFDTLTEMLDLLRDQQSSAHEEHLSRIVIFLIFSTMCLGMLQILTTILGSRFGAALGLFGY